MTVLTSIPNGASYADIRATLNNFFSRIQAREGGTMPVLTQILDGSSYGAIRETINSALTRLSALEAGGTVTPTLTLTGPLTYATNAAAGTLVANIVGVPAGVTPTITPNDGRLVVAGSAGAWTVVTGMTASTAGTIALAAAATGATGATASVVVTAASGTAVTVDPLVTRSGNVYTFIARRTANLSNAETHTMTVAGSTSRPPAAYANDYPGNAFPTTTASFAAGAATAPFSFTSPIAQPE